MSDAYVREFVSSYAREYDFYNEAARLCQQQCQAVLSQRGIRAIVTHRAKDPSKLERKLQQRHSKIPYSSTASIRDDIVDLAGVRIALYFPGDQEKADTAITETFRIEKIKDYPDRATKKSAKRFDGYHARHYRLYLKIPNSSDLSTRYGDARIEIQLGSVLMHAWAEVEHDLIYKPDSGELSEDEYAILDELNGLVLAGEIALERLQRAGSRRIDAKNTRLENHFDLASLLYRQTSSRHAEAPHIGRVDVLWELLELAGENSPEHVKKYLDAIDIASNSDSIADQIADAILTERADLYPRYVSLQMRLAIPSIYGAQNPPANELPAKIGEFLARWIVIEKTFNLIDHDPAMGANRAFRPPYAVANQVGIPGEIIKSLHRLQRFRNLLIHGIEIPSSDLLQQAIIELDGVLACLKAQPDERVKAAFERARQSIEQPSNEAPMDRLR